jgi:3-oxoacyl-[acyl-carrier protein] reductase
MEKRLINKTAIVTGGCRGIGKAIVERLAKEGARVFALDYVLPKQDEIFIDDKDSSSSVSCIQTDVTSYESCQTSVDAVIKETGRIDILVNNAGITRDNLVLRMSVEEWSSVIDTNLKGAFLMSKAVARTMMGQRQGRIINIGSIVGITGNAGQANYSSSKAGLIGLTKSLAKEFGSRNILVNCIAPGFVITSMTNKLTEEQKSEFLKNIPLKRAAEPVDIANVAAFLTTEDSSYITGQVFNVDGGMVM